MELNKMNLLIYLLPYLKGKQRKKMACIAGDYNIDLLKINKIKQIGDYFDELTNNNFMTLITQITATTKSLIDNIIFNHFVSGIKSGNINVSISDHVPQFTIIPYLTKNVPIKNKEHLLETLKNIDKTLLVNTLKAEMFGTNSNDDSNLDDDISKLLDSTNGTIEQLPPLKKISKQQLKSKLKPWITNEILKAIKIRDKTYTKLKNTTDTDKK